MSTSTDATDPDVASFAGEILLQKDAGGLAVDLRVTESRVTLRSGVSELGAWPASGVSITPLGNGTYDFLAEGDQLTFIPSDPSAFATNSLITLLAPLPPPKRWRIRKPKAPAPPATATEPRPMTKDRPAEANTAVDDPRPRTKSRRTRVDSADDEPTPAPQPAVDRPKRKLRIRRVRSGPAAVRLPEDEATMPHDDPAPAAARGAFQPKPQVPAAGEGSRRQRAWLATLDQARQYDLFGLDRVPVTRKMRQGAAHKHTWDHRVSAGFASRHVCTICGKLRVSSR